MTEERSFDVVVLGGGSGGYATALRAAQLGRSVGLVERDKLGGTCLHRGCIPTKALLHAAEIADAARSGSSFGVRSTFDGVDVAALHTYRDAVVGRLHQGLQGLVKSGGIALLEGEGRLAGPGVVDVEGPSGRTRCRAEHVVLATGSAATVPRGIELGPRVVTSDDALRLERLPDRAVVVGGSVIGVEFASAWASLGVEVVVVETQESLIPTEEPVLGHQLARAFRSRGIEVRTGTGTMSVTEDQDRVSVHLDDGDQLAADLVLVATGRAPVTDGLGLVEAGVSLDRAGVVVDEALCTSVSRTYAVGDLVPGPQLAHRGFAHGIFVAEHLAGLEPLPVDDDAVPRVVYSDPEVSVVGLSESRARERLGSVEAYQYDLAGNGRSQILGTGGLVKVVREQEGPIVGVHMIGSRMGEQVGEAALWVGWEAMPRDVARFLHAHPTQSEALGEAGLALAGKPLHVHA